MLIELKRDVTQAECPWLHADLPAGTKLHTFGLHTYGCISSQGTAVSEKEDEYPFFEIPANSWKKAADHTAQSISGSILLEGSRAECEAYCDANAKDFESRGLVIAGVFPAVRKD